MGRMAIDLLEKIVVLVKHLLPAEISQAWSFLRLVLVYQRSERDMHDGQAPPLFH